MEKTEYMNINQANTENLKSSTGIQIKRFNDFKYIGSYVSATEKYVKIRLAKSWEALHAMNNIWKSNLANNLKRNFFRATVESVLVYGAITWTLTKSLEKSFDGNYTRMLRVALNKSWRDHPK